MDTLRFFNISTVLAYDENLLRELNISKRISPNPVDGTIHHQRLRNPKIDD
jgi:hypothetical protein